MKGIVPKLLSKAQAGGADMLKIGWIEFPGRVMKKVWLIGLWLLPAASVWAVAFQAAMDKVEWHVQGSIYECSIGQDIPFYGDAMFLRRAGEAVAFQLRAKTPRLAAGQALVAAVPPSWKPGGKARNLGQVTVPVGAAPVQADARLTEKMLAELQAGMQVVVTRRPLYDSEAAESLHLAISAINFRPAYRQYLDCLAGLLPVNYDQVSRLSIYFPGGDQELPPAELKKLENLITYIKADPSVSAFYVDGHTDSEGSRADNLELSEQRAEKISQYLQEHGVAAEKITTRWHGERYPVVSNRTREGRAKNRRVTIRLERTDDAGNNVAGAEPLSTP